MVAFNPDKDIPDLSGKTILVTGGNTGLGLESIKQLIKHNPAEIFLAARSQDRAERAIQQIREGFPKAGPITFLKLDLGSFDSIKTAAEEFKSKSSRLHILMNNAGIMACPAGLTTDGYEIQLGTNHLGHALFTKLLLPTLRATAEAEGPSADVRIVVLSSGGERLAPTIWSKGANGGVLGEARTDMAGRYSFLRYGASKVANAQWARALSRREPKIKVACVHPGAVATELGRGMEQSFPWLAPLFRLGYPLVATGVANGARNQLWASVSPDVKTGEFYFPVGVAGKGSAQLYSEELAEELWEWTEKELEGA